MDRKIPVPKHRLFPFVKAFEYLDIFPYAIALLLIGGSIYILNAFTHIALK